MAVFGHTLLVPDCDDVFRWLEEHAGTSLVRKMGYHSLLGWTMKIAFDDPDVSTKFAKDWDAYNYDRIYADRKKAFEEITALPGDERTAAYQAWKAWVVPHDPQPE